MSENLNTYKRLFYSLLTINALVIIYLIVVPGDFFTTSKTNSKPGLLFNEGVETQEAKDRINRFRNDIEIRKKTSLIWYEADSIQSYINGFYKQFVSLNSSLLPQNCKWVVGFYPSRRNDERGNKNRVDFLVIPTVYDTVQKKIYDFYSEEAQKLFYLNQRLLTPKFLLGCDKCVAFDSGQLWP